MIRGGYRPTAEPSVMARVKGVRKMPATEVEVKSIRVELDGADHQRFRVEAAKEGRSMAAVARRLIEDYLKRKAGGK
jgi:ParG